MRKTRPKQETLQIGGMEVLVSYAALIPRVFKNDWDGVTAFTTSRRLPRSNPKEEIVERVYLSAFSVRDEFLEVATEEQALAFLRKNGELLPSGDAITWPVFQLWQRLTELVRERRTLLAANKSAMSSKRPHPDAELDNVLRLMTGIYSHQFFGPPAPETRLSDRQLAGLRRRGHSPESIAAQFRQGRNYSERTQRELEHWFATPPPSAYSIEWIPRKPERDNFFETPLSTNGTLIDALLSHEALRPLLVIKATCALHAIAAAAFAERIAGIRALRCEACRKWFRVGSQKSQTYCNETCRTTARKRTQRQNQRQARQLENSPSTPVA